MAYKHSIKYMVYIDCLIFSYYGIDRLFIYDFDDTLFPTRDLDKRDNKNFVQFTKNTLSQILQKLFFKMHGSQIFVVTNAKMVWIEDVYKLFPFYKKLFEQYSVQVVSAQDRWGHLYPKEYGNWKHFTFFEILKQFPSINSFISVGDSLQEYIAAGKVAKKYKINKSIKIKMIDDPMMEQIQNQLEFIVENLNDLESMYFDDMSINDYLNE
eukprot:54199_1